MEKRITFEGRTPISGLTRVLIRSDGHPVRFDDAESEDVAQRGQEYDCSFKVTLSSSLFGPLVENTTARLVLTCDSSMASELTNRGQGQIYSAVARISAVSSYEDIKTQEDEFPERRFTITGTELGQEHVSLGAARSLDELFETTAAVKSTPDGANIFLETQNLSAVHPQQ